MKDYFLAILGSFLIGSGTPASANWIEVGHIVVHDQGERFMRDFTMPGPVGKLRLKADGGEYSAVRSTQISRTEACQRSTRAYCRAISQRMWNCPATGKAFKASPFSAVRWFAALLRSTLWAMSDAMVVNRRTVRNRDPRRRRLSGALRRLM